MANLLKPVIGGWYRHIDKGGLFQIIDAGEDPEGTVEVQSFDGNVEEFSGEEWHTLQIEPCEQPEDWTGPYDGVEQDDLGYSETETAADWQAPLDEALPRTDAWEETVPEEKSG